VKRSDALERLRGAEASNPTFALQDHPLAIVKMHEASTSDAFFGTFDTREGAQCEGGLALLQESRCTCADAIAQLQRGRPHGEPFDELQLGPRCNPSRVQLP
jgi:hypothetical protein